MRLWVGKVERKHGELGFAPQVVLLAEQKSPLWAVPFIVTVAGLGLPSATAHRLWARPRQNNRGEEVGASSSQSQTTGLTPRWVRHFQCVDKKLDARTLQVGVQAPRLEEDLAVHTRDGQDRGLVRLVVQGELVAYEIVTEDSSCAEMLANPTAP